MSLDPNAELIALTGMLQRCAPQCHCGHYATRGSNASGDVLCDECAVPPYVMASSLYEYTFAKLVRRHRALLTGEPQRGSQ